MPHRPAKSSDFISRTLASGGDRRIVVPQGSNTNIYGASPFPRSTLAYGASTANDISLAAFSHLEQLVDNSPAGALFDHAAYSRALESVRERIRTLFGLGDDIDIVFAPSGTDLEYVALALAAARSGSKVCNILLGQDEVGSGCALAAGGRYFADETVLCPRTSRGEPIDGLGEGQVIALDIRSDDGAAFGCAQIQDQMADAAAGAIRHDLHPLLHVVHGSKTGLALPDLAGMDALNDRFGTSVSWVVDACQLRLDAADIRAYLDRDAVVMLTGSKFAGGPPFSGFALVPSRWRPRGPLAAGLSSLFRRAEWPSDYTACDHLPIGANPGLLLRLEAALFEIERFAGLSSVQRDRVTSSFCSAVNSLAQLLGASLITPLSTNGGLHRSTLATLDLSGLPSSPDLEMARRWHRVLAARGVRLGQPVKCLRRPDGGWKGNIRISLSMPLITELSALDDDRLQLRLARDMAQVAAVVEAAQRPIVA